MPQDVNTGSLGDKIANAEQGKEHSAKKTSHEKEEGTKQPSYHL